MPNIHSAFYQSICRNTPIAQSDRPRADSFNDQHRVTQTADTGHRNLAKIDAATHNAENSTITERALTDMSNPVYILWFFLAVVGRDGMHLNDCLSSLVVLKRVVLSFAMLQITKQNSVPNDNFLNDTKWSGRQFFVAWMGDFSDQKWLQKQNILTIVFCMFVLRNSYTCILFVFVEYSWSTVVYNVHGPSRD